MKKIMAFIKGVAVIGFGFILILFWSLTSGAFSCNQSIVACLISGF